MTSEASSLKDEGNEHFKAGRYDQALSCYKKALDSSDMKDLDKAVIYKNKAACYLKLGKHQDAVDNATSSLELAPNDPKALFRRCQGFESLGKLEEAYKDAAHLIKLDPGNKAVRPVFNKLNVVMQERIKKQNSTTHKVTQMFNITFDVKAEKEKRIQGLNNLVVLSRDDVGAMMVIRENGLSKLKAVLVEKDTDILQAAVRVLATLAKGSKERCGLLLEALDLPTILRLMSAETEDMASSVALLLQNLVNFYCGLDAHQEAVKKHEEAKKRFEKSRPPQFKLDEAAQTFVHQLFDGLIKMLISSKVTGFGRDSAMELITKNVVSKGGLDWGHQFLETKGVDNLLTVAGTQPEWKIIPITGQSSMHASVALSKIYNDLHNDQDRDKFKEHCHDHFRELFSDEDFDSKIEAVAAVSTLLQGPYEVGSAVMSLEGVVPLVLALADSPTVKHQLIAVEAIVSTAQKKDKCSGILQDAVPVLKKLYQSPDDQVKVRALVGLCKLGSFGGTDASLQPMQDGSSEKLALICRRFLTSPGFSVDIHKWATEGLAYLTLQADIKEELVADTNAIKAIFKLSKEKERNLTYACVTVLVNVTNSYDKQEVPEEMVELARYAKQHIPKKHEKDEWEFVALRIQALARAGVINALVALSSTDSENSRELLTRVYMSLATEENLRGLLVQQGAVKSLLNLQNDNTQIGTNLSAHALAKIAVTQDPNIAFQGQRMYEVVRPLVNLLDIECTGLQNFEALMGLTNLASISESVRNRILQEKGFTAIEHHMFQDHEMLRRAACECMCNLVMSEKVQEMFEGENERVKLLVLYVGEDDIKLVKAVSGALAVLSARPAICKKIVAVGSWLDIYQVRTVSEIPDIQFRAIHTIMNLITAGEETARKVVDSPLLEILMAVSKDKDEAFKLSQNAASEALEHAVEMNLIKPNEKGKAPEKFLEILRAQLRKAAAEEEQRRKEEEEEEERERKKEEEEKRLAREKVEQSELAKDREFEEEFSEEIVAEPRPDDGPKIRELTEEEIKAMEEEDRKKKKNKQGSGKKVSFGSAETTVVEDEDAAELAAELDKGDVWNDESGLEGKK